MGENLYDLSDRSIRRYLKNKWFTDGSGDSENLMLGKLPFAV